MSYTKFTLKDMKKALFITFALTLFTISIHTQWIQISQIGNNELHDVKFFNELTGIAAGEGGIWRSTNSGVNWTSVWNFGTINSISFLTVWDGLAAGNDGKVLKTGDGGITWISTNTSISENLYSIDWTNSSIGYAVGAGGRIIKTVNFGNAWYVMPNTMNQDLRSIYMVDPLNGYIAGGTTSELFAMTVSGGNNWNYSLNQAGNRINSMYCFPSFSKILLAGSNGIIRKSTNFGSTWSIPQSGTVQALNHVIFTDDVTGYIVGNEGLILKSTNGGTNWLQQESSVAKNLNRIDFLSTNMGWIVGNNGVVLRTGIPLIVNGNSNLPVKFELLQNYPNPFNPVTQIKFLLPQNSIVELKIYNTIGEEVARLVNNEFRSAGSYSVTFDGSNFGSGIYFYSIEAGNYTETKKMLLIK